MFFRAIDTSFYWCLGVPKVFKDFKYIKQLEKFLFLFLFISFLSPDFTEILPKRKKTKKQKNRLRCRLTQGARIFLFNYLIFK